MVNNEKVLGIGLILPQNKIGQTHGTTLSDIGQWAEASCDLGEGDRWVSN